MKDTKTLTALLFVTFILFLLGLLGALGGLALFFKNINWVLFFALVIPSLVIGTVSLILYFIFRDRVNKIEEENKKVPEEAKTDN